MSLKILYDLYTKEIMYLLPKYRAEELIKQYQGLKTKALDRLQQRLVHNYIVVMMDSYAILSYEKYSDWHLDDMDMRKI